MAGDSVAIKGAESIEPGKNIHPVFIRFYLTKWENGIILKGNLQELETFQLSETAVFRCRRGAFPRISSGEPTLRRIPAKSFLFAVFGAVSTGHADRNMIYYQKSVLKEPYQKATAAHPL